MENIRLQSLQILYTVVLRLPQNGRTSGEFRPFCGKRNTMFATEYKRYILINTFMLRSGSILSYFHLNGSDTVFQKQMLECSVYNVCMCITHGAYHFQM